MAKIVEIKYADNLFMESLRKGWTILDRSKMSEFETSVKIIAEEGEPTRFVLIKDGIVLGEQELTPGQDYRFLKLIEEI